MVKAGSRMHFVFIFIVFEWKYNYFRMLKIAPSATKVAVRTFFRRSVSCNPIIFFTKYFINRVFFERYLVFNSNWKPMKLNSCDQIIEFYRVFSFKSVCTDNTATHQMLQYLNLCSDALLPVLILKVTDPQRLLIFQKIN